MLKPSCIALAAVVTSWSGAALGQTPTSYTASWTSVDQHPAAPEWFKDAKFGIYFHWGAFGTAQYGSEWYPRRMYDRNDLFNYHNQTYGDPLSSWPYDKFITGANDKSGRFVQFAPKLVSAGGKWDPDAWAQLFVDAGARFAGPVMEHHDGFSMWDSKVNEWNSLSKGPLLNLAKLHTDAFRKRGLKILAAMHHAYNFTGYYQFAPTPSDVSLQKLYGKLSATAENQLWYDKLKEVVDEFQPDIVWQDFNLTAVDEARRLQFLAYYYNAALSWKKEVVATYKDGFNNRGEVFDYERGGPGDITNPYWLTDDTVSSASWSYVNGMPYYTDAQIVHSFIDRVSKNGNLLLNISPLPDGSIPQRQNDILIAIGTFLKQNGTAIYNTRAWTVYGEGPTKMGGGAFTAPTAGTASDVRYTASKDGDAIYAIILGWPGSGRQITLTSVTPTRFNVGTGKVFLFAPLGGGAAASLAFSQDGSGLHVTLPSAQPYTAVAYAMKISKSGIEPAPTPTIDGSNPDGGAPDGGGMDASQTGTGGAGGAGGRGGSGGSGGRGGAGVGGTSGTSGAAGRATGTGGTAGIGGATGGVAGGGASGIGGTVAAGSAGSASGPGGTTGASGAGGLSAGRGGGAAGAGAGTGGTSGPGLDNGSAGCTCALAARGATPTGADVILVFVALVLIAFRRNRRARRPHVASIPSAEP